MTANCRLFNATPLHQCSPIANSKSFFPFKLMNCGLQNDSNLYQDSIWICYIYHKFVNTDYWHARCILPFKWSMLLITLTTTGPFQAQQSKWHVWKNQHNINIVPKQNLAGLLRTFIHSEAWFDTLTIQNINILLRVVLNQTLCHILDNYTFKIVEQYVFIFLSTSVHVLGPKKRLLVQWEDIHENI